MVKEFVECLEELLLVRAIEFSEKRGVVGFAFLLDKASTDFGLAIERGFVTKLLVSSTK